MKGNRGLLILLLEIQNYNLEDYQCSHIYVHMNIYQVHIYAFNYLLFLLCLTTSTSVPMWNANASSMHKARRDRRSINAFTVDPAISFVERGRKSRRNIVSSEK